MCVFDFYNQNNQNNQVICVLWCFINNTSKMKTTFNKCNEYVHFRCAGILYVPQEGRWKQVTLHPVWISSIKKQKANKKSVGRKVLGTTIASLIENLDVYIT